MEIGYFDLGSPQSAGEINKEGYVYAVGYEHISAWKKDQTIRFNAVQEGMSGKAPRYELTTPVTR